MRRAFAFIFARGGSKGLPGKNIKHLQGKPLLAYAIEVAKEVNIIEKVFVSTDCDKIAEVAREFGAIVIERPIELATDSSPEWLSWRHAIEYAKLHHGDFDLFFSLPTTSPLRQAVDVTNAYDKLTNSHADICISVTPANRSPYFNMVSLSSEGFANLVIMPDGAVARRQDAPKVFDITTVVYAASVNFIENNSAIFSGKVVASIVPKERSVDIDDIFDFYLAEAILKASNQNVDE